MDHSTGIHGVQVVEARRYAADDLDPCLPGDLGRVVGQKVAQATAADPLGDDTYVGGLHASADEEHDVGMTSLREDGHFCLVLHAIALLIEEPLHGHIDSFPFASVNDLPTSSPNLISAKLSTNLGVTRVRGTQQGVLRVHRSGKEACFVRWIRHRSTEEE